MTYGLRMLLTGATAALLLSSVVSAQEYIESNDIGYGFDDGDWANDGECDDPRFMGPGMTTTTLLDADRFHDASDCRVSVEAGTIWLVSPDNVDFGSDGGDWANDDECDDPRFRGNGMTTTTLLDADIRNDATDCRNAYFTGALTFTGLGESSSSIDFGSDGGDWANDGECDDSRFAGRGMTNTKLNAEDVGRDASDCRSGFNAGNLALRGGGGAVTNTGVNFGDNSSQWANDGECDDPRFVGAGMTTTTLLEADILHDANDCEAAYNAGTLTLR